MPLVKAKIKEKVECFHLRCTSNNFKPSFSVLKFFRHSSHNFNSKQQLPIIFWKKEAHTIQQNGQNFSSVKNLSIWCHSRLLSNHIVSSIVRLSFVVQKAKVKPQQNILYCIHNCYALYVFLTQISQRKSLFISKSSSTVQMQKVN